jgi:hypothetical protein
VDIADVTNIRPTAREEPKPAEQPPEEVVPPAPEPQPQAAAEAAEDTPPPPPEESPEPEERTPPPPPRKPTPPKPQTAWNPDSIVALLDKRAPRTAPPQQAPRAARTQRGIGDMNAATMDIKAAFQKQMQQCWYLDAGVPNPERLIIKMEIRLTPDGHLAGSAQLSPETRAAMNSDPYMRAAGEAALRAVGQCEPYRLPQDRYAMWRELDLEFTPKEMVGQ